MNKKNLKPKLINRFFAAALIAVLVLTLAGCSWLDDRLPGLSRRYDEISGAYDGGDGYGADKDAIINALSDEEDSSGDESDIGEDSMLDGSADLDIGSADATEGVDGEDETYPQTVITREQILAQIPHYQTRFYISQFDDDTLNNFAALYKATVRHDKSCTFITKITEEEFNAIAFALEVDCPELFCLDKIDTYYSEGDGERNIISADISYLMDADEYDEKLEEVGRAIDSIISMADKKGGDICQAAYEILTTSCSYNLSTRNCGGAYGALVEKQAKCDGVSKAYMWLLEELGENAHVAVGIIPGDPEGHAWTVVNKGGAYYAIDATADLCDTYKSGKTSCWYPAYETSLDWVENLYTSSQVPSYFDPPEGHDMSESYHAKHGSFCKDGEDEHDRIYDAIAEAYDAESHTALLQFESEPGYTYFLNEWDNIVTEWIDDKAIGSIEYSYGATDEYRTVELKIVD